MAVTVCSIASAVKILDRVGELNGKLPSSTALILRLVRAFVGVYSDCVNMLPVFPGQPQHEVSPHQLLLTMWLMVAKIAWGQEWLRYRIG